jgi:hypothetical protein
MDAGSKPPLSFGKRQPAGRDVAPRRANAPPPVPLDAPREVFSEDRSRYVPTKLLPILIAGLVLLVIESAIGEWAGMIGGAGGRPHDFNPRDITTLWSARDALLPLMLVLVYQSCHLAAIYSMGAHIVLRWLHFSSLPAYAIGGFCASFALISIGSMQGDPLQPTTCGIELIGGAAAGFLYRLFAGTVATALSEAKPAPSADRP